MPSIKAVFRDHPVCMVPAQTVHQQPMVFQATQVPHPLERPAFTEPPQDVPSHAVTMVYSDLRIARLQRPAVSPAQLELLEFPLAPPPPQANSRMVIMASR